MNFLNRTRYTMGLPAAGRAASGSPLEGASKNLYELNPKSEARNQKQISDDLNLNDQNKNFGGISSPEITTYHGIFMASVFDIGSF
jgi:hypothetical protein